MFFLKEMCMNWLQFVYFIVYTSGLFKLLTLSRVAVESFIKGKTVQKLRAQTRIWTRKAMNVRLAIMPWRILFI